MFVPIVVVLRNWLGAKQFAQIRGKAIALHAQVITQVCDWMGVDRTQRQNLIRLARDNGKRLGLMA